MLDINFKLWSDTFIKRACVIVPIVIIAGIILFVVIDKSIEVSKAAEVPNLPIINFEEKDNEAHFFIETEEDREGREFVYYISEDGENFTEALFTEEKTSVIDGFEYEKDYFVKAIVRVPYEENYISSDFSETITIQLSLPAREERTTIEGVETPAVAMEEGFVGFDQEPHYTAIPWADEVERQLRNHGVYTDERKAVILNIIYHESTGREHVVNSLGYTGLLQFGEQWKHDYPESYFDEHDIPGEYQEDNRLSGNWSIHRLVEVIVASGDDGIKQHWAETWNK